jgi:hypothetical protein
MLIWTQPNGCYALACYFGRPRSDACSVLALQALTTLAVCAPRIAEAPNTAAKKINFSMGSGMLSQTTVSESWRRYSRIGA